MVGDNRPAAGALSETDQMSLYSEYVFPRVIDLAMKNPVTRRVREIWIPQADGEGLAVGIGSSLNLESYTKVTNYSLTAATTPMLNRRDHARTSARCLARI
jgi:hypothetical protein